MKKNLLNLLISSILVLSGLGVPVFGQVSLPHYDGLDYTVGVNLSAQSGWTVNGTSGDEILISSGNLSYTGLPTSTGNKASFAGGGIDTYKSIEPVTSGTVYYSFILKVTDIATATNAAGGYFTGFASNSTTFGGCAWLLRNSDLDFKIGLSPRTSAPVATNFTSGVYTLNTEIFIVLSYQFNSASGDDVVKMWINPSSTDFGSATEPAASLTFTNTGGTDLSTISSFFIRQDSDGETPAIEMDELRVSTNWDDVTSEIVSAPDVTAPVFTTGYPEVTNVNSTQADLEVNMDEAGKAYYVVVPDGSTAPTTAEVVAGANYGTVTLAGSGTITLSAGSTTGSETITGLTDKTNYDIYVVAEDDETTPNRQTNPVLVNLYTVTPPEVIYSADFATSLSPFTAVSITGDQVWTATSGYASMNGFSGSALDNEDWLISEPINTASGTSLMMSFSTWTKYSGGSFSVKISSDFTGTYDAANIATATWTDITSNFTLASSSVFTESGEFSLGAYTGTVYIAFIYTSTTTGAAQWEVDNFKVTGYPVLGTDATLSDIKVDATSIAGFAATTYAYTYVVEAGVTTIPAITYTLNDAAAIAVFAPATDLAGDAAARTATITVTAADGVTTKAYTVLFNPIIAVADLAALRAISSDAYDRTYQVTGEITLTAINTSAARNQKYLQDATAGILVDDQTAKLTTVYAVGDGITGMTGTLTSYFDMLEFVPVRDAGAATHTGLTVTPQVITVSEFNTNFENYEAELITIEALDFTLADGTLAFAEKVNYDATVGTDATVVRTALLGTDLNGVIVPNMADVTGIAIWDFNKAKIAPRKLADLNIYTSDATLSDLTVDATTVSGFDAATLTYNVNLTAGTTVVPTVAAVATDANAAITVTQATSLSGDAAARTATVVVVSQDKSVTTTYSIVFTVLTGINNNAESLVKIYPVPATTTLYINGIESVTLIEVFNVTGIKVQTITDKSALPLQLGNYKPGVYFIRFTTADGTFMKKFMKQ